MSKWAVWWVGTAIGEGDTITAGCASEAAAIFAESRDADDAIAVDGRTRCCYVTNVDTGNTGPTAQYRADKFRISGQVTRSYTAEPVT